MNDTETIRRQAGSDGSANFPTTADAIQSVHAGGINDVLVTKFSPAGQLQFSTFIGGTGADYGRDRRRRPGRRNRDGLYEFGQLADDQRISIVVCRFGRRVHCKDYGKPP